MQIIDGNALAQQIKGELREKVDKTPSSCGSIDRRSSCQQILRNQ